MCMDPYKRLGSNGIHEVKEHPFFEDIEWDALTQGCGPLIGEILKMKGKEESTLMHPKANEKDDFLKEVMND